MKLQPDFLGYKFTCFDWHNKPITDSATGIYFNAQEVRVCHRKIENLSFWIHEFIECTIINIFYEIGVDWKKPIHFKKSEIKPMIISHIIAPFGINNRSTLYPLTRTNRAKW